MKTSELLTTMETAKALKISVITLQRWRDQGLPYKKYGTRTFRYDLQEVSEWLEKRNQPEQEVR